MENLIDPSIIFVDCTHIKANANKYKRIKHQVKIVSNKYQKELENEIDVFREINGRDKFFDDDDHFTIDDHTGEVIEKDNEEYKTITKSTVDPDAGMFVKGGHERQFAYVDQIACDKYGWIFGYDVNPCNMHDSKAFLPFFEDQLLAFKPDIICGDAAYLTAQIAKKVQENNVKLLTPYMAPKGKRSSFRKKQFSYQMEIDAYLCPNRKCLEPVNITRDGYVQYQISKKECIGCPFISGCMKTYTTKTITRHIYEDCVELAKSLDYLQNAKKFIS